MLIYTCMYACVYPDTRGYSVTNPSFVQGKEKKVEEEQEQGEKKSYAQK